MKKPTVLTPDDPVIKLGHLFDTPLVVKHDISQIPISQFATTVIFYRHYNRKFPSRSFIQKFSLSLGSMMVLLGSEWCHNLAHVFMSSRIAKPVDAIRVNFGMPLLVFYDPEDPNVTPSEHMLRASGGPFFNMITLVPLRIISRHTRNGTPANILTNLAFETNLFLSIASLAPVPFLDGGPLLKWSLVNRGRSTSEAERVVRRSNGITAVIFSLIGALAYLRGKRFFGILFALVGLGSLTIALGWVEEAY